jgi:hypothetical protein
LRNVAFEGVSSYENVKLEQKLGFFEEGLFSRGIWRNIETPKQENFKKRSF